MSETGRPAAGLLIAAAVASVLVIGVAPAAARAASPVAAQPPPPATEKTRSAARSVHEGVLEIQYADDFDSGRMRRHFVVRTADGHRYPVHGDLSGVPAGSRVTTSGDVLATARPAAEPDGVYGGLGPHTTAVVLINFVNHPVRPFRRGDMHAAVFTDRRSANAYWQQSTGGQLSLTGIEDPAGDVFGWYTIPYTDHYCGDSDLGNWALAAASASAADGHDLSAYDNVLYVFPMTPACSFGGRAAGIGAREAWLNGYATQFFDREAQLAAHELGHDFGLWHAHSRSCVDAAGEPVTLGVTCTDVEYGDPFDAMGGDGDANLASTIDGFRRLQLGTLPATSLTDVTSSGTYTLHPVEARSGTRLLRLPRGRRDPYYANPYYYLEYRKISGRFDRWTAGSPVVNGISIRVGGDPPGETWLLDTHPATPTEADAPLLAGRRFRDPVDRLTVKVLSVSPRVARVRITLRSRPTLVAAAPGVVGPGGAITLDGAGFAQSSAVTVVGNCSTTSCPDGTTLASVTTDSYGHFTRTVTVPAATATGSTYSIAARGSDGTLAVREVQIAPTLVVGTPSGPAGRSVWVTGSGFTPGESVSLRWNCADAACAGAVVGSATANSSGAFGTGFLVPAAIFGPHQVGGVGSLGGFAAMTYTLVPSVVAQPGSAPAGGPIVVTGHGYAAGESVHVRLLCEDCGMTDVMTDDSGSFVAHVNVPVDAPNGTVDVRADSTALQLRIEGAFTVAASAGLSPTTGRRGQRVTLTGSGYRPDEDVDVYWDCDHSCTGPVLTSVVADGSGHFAATTRIPRDASFAGHRIAAIGRASSDVVSVAYTVRATLAVSPTSGIRKSTTTVTGTGFDPHESVAVRWDCANAACGQPVVRTVQTTRTGTFETQLRIPGDATTRHNYAIAATGLGSGGFAYAYFNVVTTLVVGPTPAPRGTTVTLTGAGFDSNTALTVKWDCSWVTCDSTDVLATPTTSAHGRFRVDVRVPTTATDNRGYTIGAYSSTADFASANLFVRAAASASPTTGSAGSQTQLTGAGFAPGETVTVKWDCTYAGCGSTTVLGAPSADGDGAIGAALMVPADAISGRTYHIAAIGNTSGIFVSAPFTVS